MSLETARDWTKTCLIQSPLEIVAITSTPVNQPYSDEPQVEVRYHYPEKTLPKNGIADFKYVDKNSSPEQIARDAIDSLTDKLYKIMFPVGTISKEDANSFGEGKTDIRDMKKKYGLTPDMAAGLEKYKAERRIPRSGDYAIFYVK